jgi:hypothetical protein
VVLVRFLRDGISIPVLLEVDYQFIHASAALIIVYTAAIERPLPFDEV